MQTIVVVTSVLVGASFTFLAGCGGEASPLEQSQEVAGNAPADESPYCIYFSSKNGNQCYAASNCCRSHETSNHCNGSQVYCCSAPNQPCDSPGSDTPECCGVNGFQNELDVGHCGGAGTSHNNQCCRQKDQTCTLGGGQCCGTASCQCPSGPHPCTCQ